MSLFTVPDDPAERPHMTRRAMRVLLVDEDDRMLLWHDSDPGCDPVARMWITTGGGVDPGETDLETAVRELHEETGLAASHTEVVGPVATRVVTHGFSDQVTVQTEGFFLVRCGAFEPDVSGHTEDEQFTLTGHRWWSREELESTDEEIWPKDLVRIWDIALGDPGHWPVDLGAIEESTVAV